MKLKIYYISIKLFPKDCIMQWVFKFKKYKYFKGFIIRFFGLEFNLIDSKAREKASNLFKTTSWAKINEKDKVLKG